MVDLLARRQRPLVVVMTGVTEPKLAKDLVARGVDDIVFKPVVFGMLAAKIKALVDQRHAAAAGEQNGKPAEAATHPRAEDANPLQDRVSLDDFQEKLAGITRLLPISQAALDVYNMTADNMPDIREIAETIQLDPSLAAETLRLANSTYFNTSGRPVGALNEAILRVGQKHVGELALSVSAMGLLKQEMLPWMDMNLARRRGLATSLAARFLVDQGQHYTFSDRLSISGLLHNMGRVLLGLLFPKQYEQLVHPREPIARVATQAREADVPRNAGMVVARLLESWKLPTDVWQPLRHVSDEFAVAAQLSEPLRTKVELVKVAVTVAEIVAGSWEPWDVVEFPNEVVLRRLRITDLHDVVDRTREGLEDLLAVHASGPGATSFHAPAERPLDDYLLYYWNQSPTSFDFLEELLPSMGIHAIPYDPMSADPAGHVLVNCLGRSVSTVLEDFRRRKGHKATIVIDKLQRSQTLSENNVIELPASFAALQEMCLRSRQ